MIRTTTTHWSLLCLLGGTAGACMPEQSPEHALGDTTEPTGSLPRSEGEPIPDGSEALMIGDAKASLEGCAPSGGLWCGQNGIGGDPNTLYRCNSDGVLVVQEICANGCLAASTGTPDSCHQPNSADLDCTCGAGGYHNGDPIPTSLTYCGLRVCGQDGQIYECTTADAWQPTGITCGQGECSCPGGSHQDSTPIATAHTECHVQVCGGDSQWYTCEAGGWQGVSGSTCTMGGGGPPPGGDPGSCVGHCGGNAGSCYCDNACEDYGDCCPDKAAVCGGGGVSCGDLATQQGWDWAACEWNGNGACGGQGTPTSDCDHCCGGVDTSDGFGYPVGDKTTSPAGGWSLWRPIGDYVAAYGGRHLAHDVSNGGAPSINQPVYSVADGVVRYAGSNTSSYTNVVLIEHDDGQGGTICSFYAHIHNLTVVTGQSVERGDQIAQVLDWSECVSGGYSSNTHLHYVLLNEGLCDASASASGSLICGYDTATTSLSPEPYSYQSFQDNCYASQYGEAFISPSQFIDDHHF